MVQYRLIFYNKKDGKGYYQILRNVKMNGVWTTRFALQVGVANEENKKIAEALVNFLNAYASEEGSPFATGMIDQEMFKGLKAFLALGPLGLPVGPLLALFDLITNTQIKVALESLDYEKLMQFTHSHLKPNDRKRLIRWIKAIDDPQDRRRALYIRWTFDPY